MVLDPWGEHHGQSWTLDPRIANRDVTTRGAISGFVTTGQLAPEMSRIQPAEVTNRQIFAHKAEAPRPGSRGLQRSSGLPSVHSQ